uniref:Uncharacterized protein n=1 Tax=Opuntia streptacantha TaxID=393608 RepID=A0A7C9F2J0_OPUST
MVQMPLPISLRQQLPEQIIHLTCTIVTPHTHPLQIHIAMEVLNTQIIIVATSSSLINHILKLKEPTKTQVLLISLFPHFRIPGLMLGLQVIQALTTILVIIRQLELTQEVVTAAKLTCGVKEVIQTIMQIIIKTQAVPTVQPMLLQLQLQIMSSIINNGRTITIVRLKLLVHLEQKILPSPIQLLCHVQFLVLLVGM